MCFQKGKNFIHKLQQLTKLHYNIRNFIKRKKKREISHTSLNVVPIFRWKFQPKLQQLRKLQR